MVVSAIGKSSVLTSCTAAYGCVVVFLLLLRW